MVRFAAVSMALGAGGPATACGDAPCCKSTLTELLPGRRVWWESPATTSTSSGGNTVRDVTATGATGSGGSGVWTADATWCFGLCFDLAAVTGLTATAEGSAGACLAGTLSAGWSDSASGASGNQKSRSCQSTTPNANRSRQSDPTINLRCLGSWGTRLPESPSRAWLDFFTMVFRVDIMETGAASRGRAGASASMPRKRYKCQQKVRLDSNLTGYDSLSRRGRKTRSGTKLSEGLANPMLQAEDKSFAGSTFPAKAA